MNPNGPLDPSSQPSKAFSSGMPDPLSNSPDPSFDPQNPPVVVPNGISSKTLAGHQKGKENIVSTGDPSITSGLVALAKEVDSLTAGAGVSSNPAAGSATDNSPAPIPPAVDPPNNPPADPIYSFNPMVNQATTASHSPANDQFQQSQTTQQPINQTPQSYLDTIATNNSKRGGLRFLSGKMLIIIIAAAVVIIGGIAFAIASSNVQQAPKQAALDLGTELTNLQTIVKYGQTNQVKTASVVKVIAETDLISLSRTYDLGKLFTLVDTNNKNKPPAPAFIATLDSAKAQSNLEPAYDQALQDQLNATYKALQNLDDQANTTSEQQAALTQAATDLKELYRRLTE